MARPLPKELVKNSFLNSEAAVQGFILANAKNELASPSYALEKIILIWTGLKIYYFGQIVRISLISVFTP